MHNQWQRRSKFHRAVAPLFQALEQRRLLSAEGTSHPTFVIDASPSALSPPFTPAQIRQAYSLNSISANGAGQTIAIIDAYNDPDITTDVQNFDTDYSLQQFNIGGPTFTVENQSGGASPLPPNAAPGNWDIEESLDVEYAHSIAPDANIILFEANSDNNNDLYTAVNVAHNIPAVSVITMSFGGPEDPSDTAQDSLFTTPAGHQGITFIASTGDSGQPGGYPAYSPNILAVGGTSLTINSDGSYASETAWSEGGGGISQYESQPDYQTAKAAPFSTTQRTEPDVSWLADPNTGVNVLDTYANESSNGLIQIGGTSLATPMWGALIAMIDQARVADGQSTLDGPSQTLPMLYDLPANAFNDITTGNNGFAAGPGYDLATGLGTPNVPVLFSDMVGETTLYVDSAAPGITQNGSSWTDAFTTLSQALAAATGNDEILVSQGTYYPTASDDPTAAFQLQNNVAIYGGYAGYGTADPNAQNSTDYQTILSGDIGTVGDPTDNSYHVVTASYTNSTATLDGVTITDANRSNDAPNAQGAGMQVDNGSATITNCLFSDNSGTVGGALDNSDADPLLVNCTFSNNSAIDSGGAVADEGSSNATMIHCTFTNNTASFGGAVSDQVYSSSYLRDCTFTQNSATDNGGAVEIGGASAMQILSCVFENNSALDGAAVDSTDTSTPQLINCLFVGNAARSYGTIRDDTSSILTVTNCTITGNMGVGINSYSDGQAIITNSIVWNNSGGGIDLGPFTGSATVTYSDIQGGYAGTGNIDADPQFIRAPGTNGPTDNGDEHLQLTSPAIDAGDNAAVPSTITTDLDGRPRFINIPGVHDPGAIVDMGAYEAWENIVYVDTHAAGSDTGSSWTNAFTTLTAALSYAIAGQTIEVAAGTYYPTAAADRTATFTLRDDITIEGGFAGVDSGDPDTRNPALYPTILSGDIGISGNSSDNSYHVVTANYVNFTATLDGFTITAGSANANPSSQNNTSYGGGLFDDGGSPTINDCTFSNNLASIYGGAVLAEGNADPVFSNCNFTNNSTDNTFDDPSVNGSDFNFAAGGAIGDFGANPYIVDCTFTNNSAQSLTDVAEGGAIENQYSTPTIVSCTFTRNFAVGDQGGIGGALDNEADSSPEVDDCIFNGNYTNEAAGAVMNAGTITTVGNVTTDTPCLATYSNCTFTGNSAPYGGAMYDFEDASANIINCTFTNNLAEFGGAIVTNNDSSAILTNSILWADEAYFNNEILVGSADSSATATQSDIDGGYAGSGNINTDPLFLRNPDPGTDNTWGTPDDYYGNLALSSNSPAIDIGSNAAIRSGITTDIANDPRIVNIPGIHDPGAIVDLGAYEAQLLNATSFNFTSQSQITVQFSENVSTSLTANDLQLLPTFGTTPITASTLSYDSSTNTATFGFASPLPADIYTVSLNHTGVTDAAGNTLSNTYQFSFLYVPAGGSLALPGAANVYTIQQLSLGSNSTVDIGNDELIVQYTGATPAPTIQSLITTGDNNGAWNGTGIISSDLSLGTSVGYFDDGSQVTIRRTWLGDANLDGVINSDDLSLLMEGQIANNTTWQAGNFNYGAKITTDDWSLLGLGAAVSNGQSINTLFSASSPNSDIADNPQFLAASSAYVPPSLDVPLPSALAIMPSILDSSLIRVRTLQEADL